MKVARCGLVVAILIVLHPASLSAAASRQWGGGNEGRPGLGEPVVSRIDDDVYAITGLFHSAGKDFSVNAGIIFADSAVIFIDSGMTIASAEFLWKLAEERMRGDEDIYLILTHHHSDHVFGMCVFAERGATVIAHRWAGIELADDGGKYKQFIINMSKWDKETGDAILGDVILSAPDKLIERDTILTIGGEEIHLLATPGHTYDGLSVYHPASRVLFAGDEVYNHPHVTTRFGGPAEWRAWIGQLERLKKLEIDFVCPGHGDVCGTEVMDRNMAYLKEVLER